MSPNIDNPVARNASQIPHTNTQLVYLNPSKESQPSRLWGLVWIVAGAVAAVAGAALSAIGGAMVYSAFFAKGTIVGVPVGIMMGALGIALVFAGVKEGIRIAGSLVAKGWADLTRRNVTPMPVSVPVQIIHERNNNNPFGV